MSYDIISGVAPQLETGAFMQFTGPGGEPVFDADKKPVGITLVGRYSRLGLAATRAITNRRLDQARRGTNVVTAESNEAELTEVLVACTTGWTFDTMGGEAFPYSVENARRFWSDDRFRRWRNQGEDFISSEANFTKG